MEGLGRRLFCYANMAILRAIPAGLVVRLKPSVIKYFERIATDFALSSR